MVGNICRQLLRISCRACSLSIKFFLSAGVLPACLAHGFMLRYSKPLTLRLLCFRCWSGCRLPAVAALFLCSTFFNFSQVFGVRNALFLCVQFCAFSRCSLVVRSTCAAALPVVSKCALGGSFLCSHFLALSAFSRRSFGVQAVPPPPVSVNYSEVCARSPRGGYSPFEFCENLRGTPRPLSCLQLVGILPPPPPLPVIGCGSFFRYRFLYDFCR